MFIKLQKNYTEKNKSRLKDKNSENEKEPEKELKKEPEKELKKEPEKEPEKEPKQDKKVNQIKIEKKSKKTKKKLVFANNLENITTFEKYNNVMSNNYKALENNEDKWGNLSDCVNDVMKVYNIWEDADFKNFLENDFE